MNAAGSDVVTYFEIGLKSGRLRRLVRTAILRLALGCIDQRHDIVNRP